jgi:hypothetical protein
VVRAELEVGDGVDLHGGDGGGVGGDRACLHGRAATPSAASSAGKAQPEGSLFAGPRVSD